KAVAVLDRSAPGGAMGALFNEISAAMYTSENRPAIVNYIYGLGGRDMTIEHLKEIYKEMQECADAGKVVGKLQRFSGLRGPKLEFFE
ncbi:MAG: 2-ketoisovalerate ferredoxin oxidoreductase, partial [Campylobacteraceae bacterium 4484_4]